MDGIQLGMAMLLRLNVNFDVQEQQENEDTSAQEQDYLSDFQRQKIFLIRCQAAYERQRNGGKLDDFATKLACLYERRGSIMEKKLEFDEQLEARQKEKDAQVNSNQISPSLN